MRDNYSIHGQRRCPDTQNQIKIKKESLTAKRARKSTVRKGGKRSKEAYRKRKKIVPRLAGSSLSPLMGPYNLGRLPKSSFCVS
jgi:hypothetical protein